MPSFTEPSVTNKKHNFTQ